MSLELLAMILAATVVGVAVLAIRTAPAVTVALLSGLVGAVASYRVAALDGPEGVPEDVALWFSFGLLVGAIFGSAVARRRKPGTRPMARWAVGVLSLAPLACVALTLALQEACPLYVNLGLCDFHGVDVLGGWITGVVFFFAIDLLVIVALLWFSPGSRDRTTEDGEQSRSRLGSAARLAIAGAWIGLALGALVVAFARPSELEAWRSAQPDAESFAPNLLEPAPAVEGAVGGCRSFASRDGAFDVAFEPGRVRWLEGHVPGWLPDAFGLVDYAISEDRWDDSEGDYIASSSMGAWSDGACRRVSLTLFGAKRDPERFNRLYLVVDEIGDWVVVAGRGCFRSAIADGDCLHYVAFSDEGRSKDSDRILGLSLQMSGIDRDVGDKIALGIPVRDDGTRRPGKAVGF